MISAATKSRTFCLSVSISGESAKSMSDASHESAHMAAIDNDGRAGHVARGLTRGEQQERTIEIARTSGSPLRDCIAGLLRNRACEKGFSHLGCDIAGRAGIYADLMARKLKRQRRRHLRDCR